MRTGPSLGVCLNSVGARVDHARSARVDHVRNAQSCPLDGLRLQGVVDAGVRLQKVRTERDGTERRAQRFWYDHSRKILKNNQQSSKNHQKS